MAHISVFDEVGDLSRHLRSLRADIQELKRTARDIQAQFDTRAKQVAAAEQKKIEEEAAAKEAAAAARKKKSGGSPSRK